MGGGGGMSAGAGFRGPGAGAGFGAGAGGGFNARTSGPSAGTMGRGGPTGGLYNYSRSGNANVGRNNNVGRNSERFTGRTQQRGNNFAARNQGRNTYNYAGRNPSREVNQRGNRTGGSFRQGLASGNFSEHGRHFRFRRFWNGQWVFLNDWSGCTAWAWVHVAPGIWAWRPIDVCIG